MRKPPVLFLNEIPSHRGSHNVRQMRQVHVVMIAGIEQIPEVQKTVISRRREWSWSVGLGRPGHGSVSDSVYGGPARLDCEAQVCAIVRAFGNLEDADAVRDGSGIANALANRKMGVLTRERTRHIVGDVADETTAGRDPGEIEPEWFMRNMPCPKRSAASWAFIFTACCQC
jgi:hypothetical protein